jgi:hypothetical protein
MIVVSMIMLIFASYGYTDSYEVGKYDNRQAITNSLRESYIIAYIKDDIIFNKLLDAVVHVHDSNDLEDAIITIESLIINHAKDFITIFCLSRLLALGMACYAYTIVHKKSCIRIAALGYIGAITVRGVLNDALFRAKILAAMGALVTFLSVLKLLDHFVDRNHTVFPRLEFLKKAVVKRLQQVQDKQKSIDDSLRLA